MASQGKGCFPSKERNLSPRTSSTKELEPFKGYFFLWHIRQGDNMTQVKEKFDQLFKSQGLRIAHKLVSVHNDGM